MSTYFINSYECPECECTWEDEWDCQVDDDCPQCGKRHISPYHSEDLRDEDRQIED